MSGSEKEGERSGHRLTDRSTDRSRPNLVIGAKWDVVGHGPADDDDASSFMMAAVDVPNAALEPYVSEAVSPLFSNSEAMPRRLVESCFQTVIERRMD